MAFKASSTPTEGVWLTARNALRPDRRHYEQIQILPSTLQDQLPTETSPLVGMEHANLTSNTESVHIDDRAISRRLNKKIDVALLPFLSLLYLFNGLDRSNVGNAETQGMTESQVHE